MKVRKVHGTVDKVEQQMTPMIDIVFQLLTFFVMTFKIASVEGNFDVKMPLNSAGSQSPIVPPIKVYMRPTPSGAEVTMNGNVLGHGDPAFRELRSQVRNLVGPGSSEPGAASEYEVELDCEYNLPYENVIKAITAVSGYLATVNGETKLMKMVEKIKFSQPRKAPGAG